MADSCGVSTSICMLYSREASFFNQDSKVSLFIWILSSILNSKFIQVVMNREKDI